MGSPGSEADSSQIVARRLSVTTWLGAPGGGLA